MERYKERKPIILIFLTGLSVVILGLTVAALLRGLDLKKSQDHLDQYLTRNMTDFPCSQICYDKPFEESGICCDANKNNCSGKQACFQQIINDMQNQISDDEGVVICIVVTAFIALVSDIAVIVYMIRLRKLAKEEEYQMHQAQEEALLGQEEQIQEIEYDFEEQSFESYQEFIQFLIDSGYILPEMMIAPKKRGDPKITDSFVTVDEEGCSICMVELCEQKVLKLRCGHKFHSECIRDWNEANPSCPICRTNIYPQ